MLEMKGISKSFPGVQALKNVDFNVKMGTIHGLAGENGAGKSTLMKILSGAYNVYDGEIHLDGKVVRFNNEKEALNAGISIVAQELNPILDLTIAENIFIGREPVRLNYFIDNKTMYSEAEQLLRDNGLSWKPEAKMRELSVAGFQMVEIIKAISRNARIIVMDEPTSALTVPEIKKLFKQITVMKNQGVSIIFISHKLNEILTICDEVTVLRDGTLISTEQVKTLDSARLIGMMVGREITNIYPSIPEAGTQSVLKVKGLTCKGVFEDISFEVRKGEILGVAGMVGAGRTELMRAVFGMDRADKGEIFLENEKVTIRSTHDAITHGIVMVTEDRAIYGLVGIMSIMNNNLIPNMDRFSSAGFLRQKAALDASRDICEKLAVKAPSQETLVNTLSGGNQQKIVLGKWLIRDIKVLIMDEPTRGIDV